MNNENNKDKKYASGFTTLGHILTILSIVGYIIMFCIKPFVFTPLTLCLTIFSDVFIICLVYGLGDARARLSKLEDLFYNKNAINKKDKSSLYNKKIMDKKDLELFKEGQNNLPTEIPQVEGLTYCKKCGYQIFPEEKVCSNCGTKKEID